MSDLHINMMSGETLHFNVVEDGWLGGNVNETLLFVEHPEPDYTGRKPSFVYRTNQQLSHAQWIEIDFSLEGYYRQAGYKNVIFGFGCILEKTEKSVQIYNSKTGKTVEMHFEGNIIVSTKIVENLD